MWVPYRECRTVRENFLVISLKKKTGKVSRKAKTNWRVKKVYSKLCQNEAEISSSVSIKVNMESTESNNDKQIDEVSKLVETDDH